MSSPQPHPPHNATGETVELTNPPAEKADSDYGDFGDDAEELTIIESLLQEIDTQGADPDILSVTDIEDYEPLRGLRLPKVLGREATRVWELEDTQRQLQATGDLETTNPAKSSERVNESGHERSASAEPEPQPQVPDTRSPLERFRRPPKKALSVTDLISPSWCELQYSYTLSKHGRKRRTPAMKQGTEVHQALEDEIHITVPVETLKKEDSWGLRLWNIIQGLRTLQETGRTREFEIWGSIGGEIVNGVIDELSYECPDPKLEELHSKRHGQGNAGPVLPEYQTSISNYLTSRTQQEGGQTLSEALGSQPEQQSPVHQQLEKYVYITDVKTRGSATLPTGSSLRPTILQLHLYHHMLENLAQGNFALIQLAERYNFDTNETFSDSFIAQIGNLNYELFGSQQDSPSIPSSQDSMDILLQHNNLSRLWDFMLKQLRMAFILQSTASLNATPTPTPQSTSDLPPPASQPTRLSPILTAEYLSSTYKHVSGTSKKFLGRKSFVFNADFLKQYLEDNLEWWRGEREARGVMLQEAWKCRSCDFRGECEWIHERDQAAVQQALERKTMREVAGVENQSKSKV